jgi:hypothetical protein
MKIQSEFKIAFAAVLFGGGMLLATGATWGRRPVAVDVDDTNCLAEKVTYEFASEGLDRALASDDDGLIADFVRVKSEAFERYCGCLGTASATSAGVGSRAPLVTAPPRGTPSFVPPYGRPVFTPPAGPPAGQPPVTPPATPRRGRPPFTPPGPPFTPPGPPPFTPPGPVLTPPNPPLTPPPTPTPH